jgi:N6-L-threonylcarbamoyladenine synthase
VVEQGVKVRSSIVSSQVPVHRQYGGVVPELASRAHLEGVLPLITMALERAECTLADIDAVAVTAGPGLIGALMVGVHTAKALAYTSGKALVGVNHVEAHIGAIHLSDRDFPNPPQINYPHLALVVSGGHTAIYRVDDPVTVVPVGQTLDDAAGEAFDKVAKMLGLGYPGGKVIDDLAKAGKNSAIDFPRAWIARQPNSFSFSGLKTSVRNYLKKNGIPQGAALNDLCASFQEAVVHVLVKKTLRAAGALAVQDIVVAGGVAANSRLRQHFMDQAERKRLNVHLVPMRYCSDNAAMIAALGYHKLQRGAGGDFLTLDADSNLKCGA